MLAVRKWRTTRKLIEVGNWCSEHFLNKPERCPQEKQSSSQEMFLGSIITVMSVMEDYQFIRTNERAILESLTICVLSE
jgi:hypothetical protein